MQNRQLSLNLPHRPALGRDDFFVSSANEAAIALIDRWPDWPHHAVLVTGPHGSGKTHMAAVWSQQSAARCVAASALAGGHVEAAQAGQGFAVEDLDAGPFDQQLMFHLLNAARGAGAFLLLTARAEVDQWSVQLPDLVSRLRACPMVRLGAPDDALLRAVMVKQLSDRQLVLDTNVLDYLLKRMRRSLAGARRLVEALDRQALAQQRAITRGLAGQVLDMLEAGDDDGE